MVLYITSSESFLVDKRVSDIKKQLGIENKSDLNYLEPKTVLEVKDFVNSYSFFETQNKLGILNNLDDNDLIDILKDIPDNVTLLLVGNFDAKKKLYKYLKQNKLIEDIKPFDKKGLTNWIKDFGKEHNTKITLENAAHIISLTGENDMYNIQNEVLKLCMLGTPITKEFIYKVVAKSLLVNAFNLTNAILYKDITNSLEILNCLIKDNQSMIPLLSLINKNFCIIQSLIEGNETALSTIKINPWVIKNLRPYKKSFSKEKLEGYIRLCQSLDFDLKNGYEPKLVMERLILNIN